MPGTLYLIPNTLGDEDRESQLNHVLPHDTIERASQLRYWIVENAKTARALLKAVGSQSPLICPIQEMQMTEWRGPGKESAHGSTNLKAMLQPLLDGHDIGRRLDHTQQPRVALRRTANKTGLGLREHPATRAASDPR